MEWGNRPLLIYSLVFLLRKGCRVKGERLRGMSELYRQKRKYCDRFPLSGRSNIWSTLFAWPDFIKKKYTYIYDKFISILAGVKTKTWSCSNFTSPIVLLFSFIPNLVLQQFYLHFRDGIDYMINMESWWEKALRKSLILIDYESINHLLTLIDE